MLHVSSRDLRRLADEPLAVPDRARDHLAGCGRCQTQTAELAANATLAARALPAPYEVGDIDAEWAAFAARLADAQGGRRMAHRPFGRQRPTAPRRFRRISLSTGVVAVAAVVVMGAGAAAALTTIYTPTHVAPITISQSDMSAIENLTGLGSGQLQPGLHPEGSYRLPVGELTWTSAGHPQQVSSVAEASSLTHLAWSSPATLPAGVGAVRQVVIQPQVTATISFGASAGSRIAGSTLDVTGGPAIVVSYGGAPGSASLTTLVIAAMQRPTASSTGATAAELESVLLARAHLPASLAQELRLLGNPATTLPVPVLPGLTSQQLTIGGAPAVLMTVPGGVASAVIWESRDGLVHGVAGLLDSQDILNVARQIG
jgi:hypothetical protein